MTSSFYKIHTPACVRCIETTGLLVICHTDAGYYPAKLTKLYKRRMIFACNTKKNKTGMPDTIRRNGHTPAYNAGKMDGEKTGIPCRAINKV